jgi:hypothetical protein
LPHMSMAKPVRNESTARLAIMGRAGDGPVKASPPAAACPPWAPPSAWPPGFGRTVCGLTSAASPSGGGGGGVVTAGAGDGDGLVVGLGDGDGLAVGLGLGDGDGLAVGLGLGDGEVVGEGDGLGLGPGAQSMTVIELEAVPSRPSDELHSTKTVTTSPFSAEIGKVKVRVRPLQETEWTSPSMVTVAEFVPVLGKKSKVTLTSLQWILMATVWASDAVAAPRTRPTVIINTAAIFVFRLMSPPFGSPTKQQSAKRHRL